jgi:hypothetical protein
MGSAGIGFSPAFCLHCGNKLDAGVKFCAGCGMPAGPAASSPAGGIPPPTVAMAQSDDIATLERNAAEHPNDESYRKLLAVALHDDALKDWWEDPADKSLLCVSKQGLDHARAQLSRANQLQFNDPELRGHIQDKLRLVDSMEARKYTGTKLMIVVLGIFYIIPGVIWWYVNRRPGYLINWDYMTHYKTGQHGGAAARIGGLQGKVYEFFEKINEDWGWLLGLLFMLTVGVILSPIFMILAYKQNYMELKTQAA